MTSIFLSHNSKDKPFVRTLAKHLEKEGIKTWVDEAEIKIGDSLIHKISEGINKTEFLGAILSPNSINSNWVKKEIEIAMNMEINGNKVKVLPILYKECEIPTFLIGKKYGNFTDSENFLNELDELVSVIKSDSTLTKKQIKTKKIEKIDSFDKIKFIFQFATSSNGLDMYDTNKAMKFAEDWAKKYDITKIKKIIFCFNFAMSSDGLDKYDTDNALRFAVNLSEQYSTEQILKLIKIFNFAMSSDGLDMYDSDKAWKYAIRKLTE